ncbi:MAG: hypothetical protein QOC95_1850 [Thermoleophilaceae bacterium]|jgi:hypothetical protein|nr:hypothetical protein [Thermoleophilaceae bacterium]
MRLGGESWNNQERHTTLMRSTSHLTVTECDFGATSVPVVRCPPTRFVSSVS